MIQWSPGFAYAIGLLATDGCLYNDGRHLELVSNDREQVENLKKCLGINNKITRKTSGSGRGQAFRIQFGDVFFYNFLLGIGITPRKSKTIGSLLVPKKYFPDFLRGHFDGDGTFYSYYDPRWPNSFMFYTEIASASKKHVIWLQDWTTRLLGVGGRITKSKNNSVYRLKYAKGESLKLLSMLYYNKAVVCLPRKRRKVEMALKSVGIEL